MSVLLVSGPAHGRAVQSSEPLFFGPLKIGQIVLRQNGRQQRDWQILNGLRGWWQSSCWQQRQLLQMQLLSRLSTNTERDVSSKQIWLFGRRSQVAGLDEVDAGVRRRINRRRRRRHRRRRRRRRSPAPQ